ncbi:hypothetical protein P4C99_20110 [Pontiellaceae bacterium B1224]|nr:hypothetical protein [Pontiellaceae bacterium B1224]
MKIREIIGSAIVAEMNIRDVDTIAESVSYLIDNEVMGEEDVLRCMEIKSNLELVTSLKLVGEEIEKLQTAFDISEGENKECGSKLQLLIELEQVMEKLAA